MVKFLGHDSIQLLRTGDRVRVANGPGWSGTMGGHTAKLMTYFSITLLHVDE